VSAKNCRNGGKMRFYQGAFRRRNAKCMRREGIRNKMQSVRGERSLHLYMNNKKRGGGAAKKSVDGGDDCRQSRSSIRTCLHVKAILSVRNKEGRKSTGS